MAGEISLPPKPSQPSQPSQPSKPLILPLKCLGLEMT